MIFVRWIKESGTEAITTVAAEAKFKLSQGRDYGGPVLRSSFPERIFCPNPECFWLLPAHRSANLFGPHRQMLARAVASRIFSHGRAVERSEKHHAQTVFEGSTPCGSGLSLSPSEVPTRRDCCAASKGIFFQRSSRLVAAVTGFPRCVRPRVGRSPELLSRWLFSWPIRTVKFHHNGKKSA